MLLSSSRPSKVIAKAFSAGFHRVTHRALPRPVGSSERVSEVLIGNDRPSGLDSLGGAWRTGAESAPETCAAGGRGPFRAALSHSAASGTEGQSAVPVLVGKVGGRSFVNAESSLAEHIGVRVKSPA